MILVIDTIRNAREHLELNSAILERLIINEVKVDFLTSYEYWQSFPISLREKMEFKSTSRLQSGLIGSLRTILLLLKIVIFKRKYRTIIFLSSITYNSFLIAILSYLRLFRAKVNIVLHEVSYIDSKKRTEKLAGAFLKLALLIGLKNNGKFIIIGNYIKKELEKRIKFNKKSTLFIEHPIYGCENYDKNNTFKLIKFASTGVHCAEKKSQLIEDIAKYNQDLIISGAISLSTIGRLNYKYDAKLPVNHVGLNYKTHLMEIEDYSRFILEQHYLLFFIGQEYDLKTSGTIIDAIKYKKPIIALSCNLINSYFKMYGNIGHVYQCIEDMQIGVSNLCKNFDVEIYNIQVKNLIKANKTINGNQFQCEIQ